MGLDVFFAAVWFAKVPTGSPIHCDVRPLGNRLVVFDRNTKYGWRFRMRF